MRIGIVQFPGSNCERETILAVKRAGMEPVEFLWNESHTLLRELDGYIIIGGFSYEDRSRAGIIAALDPVMLEIKAQSELGKPILGICNGAQILVETGLVPGLENNKIGMCLAENKRVDRQGNIIGTGFYNTWVHLRLADNFQRNAFTRYLTHTSMLYVPIAHAEGRFVMSEALLQEINVQGLDVFHYCDANGVVDPNFPVNPNGSLANIAAISNKRGNVMAMMPHPERTSNGDAIFQSMRDYIAEAKLEPVRPLDYYPRRLPYPLYQPAAGIEEWLIELMITDNHALTVQQTLRQHGFPVTVKRFVHWEVPKQVAPEAIQNSGVLYNARKERRCRSHPQPDAKRCMYLVQAKEDLYGQQAAQTLTKHFRIEQLNQLRHGILWQFCTEKGNIAAIEEEILETHIIHNPFAHECFRYDK